MKNNNGKHLNKIVLTDEERKQLHKISSGLHANLMKIEQLLYKLNEHHELMVIKNNEHFLETIHSLSEKISAIEKLTDPLKKFL